MSKGPSKVGTQTTTTNSTPWNSSYLTGLYDAANNAYLNDKTLYQDPSVQSTYNNYLYKGNTLDQTTAPASYGAWNNAVSGGLGVANSPVYWDLYNFGKGQAPAELNLTTTSSDLKNAGTGAQGSGNTYAGYLSNLAGSAANATNDYQNTLKDTASGAYLNSNPYLDKTYNAAADAVTRAYKTATAPQSDSKYELAGRYGSGAMANATHQNQLDLGTSLDNLATNIYGKNYANERTNQLNAAESGGKLALSGINTGLTGYSDAAKAADTGYNTNINALKGSAAADAANLASQYQGLGALQSGYEAGNKNLLTGLGLTSDVNKAQTYGLDTSLTGAQGSQTYGQAATDAPWTALNRYSNLLGNPVTGSTTSSQPIYGPNSVTSAIGTGSGLLNLANSAGSAFGSGGSLSGLGSLFLK